MATLLLIVAAILWPSVSAITSYEDARGGFVFQFHEMQDVVLVTDGSVCYFLPISDLRAQGHLNSYSDAEDFIISILNHTISSQFTQRHSSVINNEYHDDIANIICRSKPLFDVDVILTTTTTTTTTTAAPCVDTVGTLMSCATLTDICLSASAAILCRKFCGLCTQHNGMTTTQPVSWTSGTFGHTNNGHGFVHTGTHTFQPVTATTPPPPRSTNSPSQYTTSAPGSTTYPSIGTAHLPIWTTYWPFGTTNPPMGATTHPPATQMPMTTTSPPPCVDLYIGNCLLDFPGQCGAPEVAKMCRKSCNLCLSTGIYTQQPAGTQTTGGPGYPTATIAPATTTLPTGLPIFGATYPPSTNGPINVIATTYSPVTQTPYPYNTGCLFSGVMHADGAVWTDGCTARFMCINGQIQPFARCYDFNLPPVCGLIPPVHGKCCFTPTCPPGVTINYPAGWIAD